MCPRRRICGHQDCSITTCQHEKTFHVCSWCGELKNFDHVKEHESCVCQFRPNCLVKDDEDESIPLKKEFFVNKRIFIIKYSDDSLEVWFNIYRSIILSIDPDALIFRLPSNLYNKNDSLFEILECVRWRNWDLRYIYITFDTTPRGAQHQIVANETGFDYDIWCLNDDFIFNPRVEHIFVILLNTPAQALNRITGCPTIEFSQKVNVISGTSVTNLVSGDSLPSFVKDKSIQSFQEPDSLSDEDEEDLDEDDKIDLELSQRHEIPRFNPERIQYLYNFMKGFNNPKFNGDINYLFFLDRQKFDPLNLKEWKQFRKWSRKAHSRRYRMKPIVSETQKGRPHKRCCYCQKEMSKVRVYTHELKCKFRYTSTLNPRSIVLLITIGSDALERSRIFGTAFGLSKMDSKRNLVSTLHFNEFDKTQIPDAIKNCEALESSFDLKNRVMVYCFADALDIEFDLFDPLKVFPLYDDHVHMFFYSLRVVHEDSWNNAIDKVINCGGSMPKKVSVSLFSHPFDYLRTLPLMIDMTEFFDVDQMFGYKDLAIRAGSKNIVSSEQLEDYSNFEFDLFLTWSASLIDVKIQQDKSELFRHFLRFCKKAEPEMNIRNISKRVFLECLFMHGLKPDSPNHDFPALPMPRKHFRFANVKDLQKQ